MMIPGVDDIGVLGERVQKITAAAELARERLQALPPAPRYRRDPHHAERALLATQLAATEANLTNVICTRDQLAHVDAARLQDSRELSAQREELSLKLGDHVCLLAALTRELAEHELSRPRTWLPRELVEPASLPGQAGEPTQRPLAAAQRLARHAVAERLARYRLRYGIHDQDRPLGAEPTQPGSRQSDYREAEQSLQRSLQRQPPGRDLGIEL